MLMGTDKKQLIDSLYLLGEEDVDDITQRLDDLYWKILASLRAKKLSAQLKGDIREIDR